MSAIKTYLDQLHQKLPRHLRDEICLEARGHLEDLTRDWQERGLSREQAEARAVAQFGAARNISNAWRNAVGIVDWPDIILAALPILGITGLGWTFIGHDISLWVYLIIFGLGAAWAWQRGWPTWWYAWLGWLFLALWVVSSTEWLFWIIFPILVTLLAVDSWQHATLMTLPFTTYVAFVVLFEQRQLITTGWGPGSIYPGNLVWIETAFSVLWIIILAASLRAARPSRRGIYLLAGLMGTQAIYVSAMLVMKIVAKMLPGYFETTLTMHTLLYHKLPVGLATISLTFYPLFVWLIARIIRQSRTRRGLPV